MSRTRKPSPAQQSLIDRIMQKGGTDVEGGRVFGVRRNGGYDVPSTTIDACLTYGWITRTERDGKAWWSVIADNRVFRPVRYVIDDKGPNSETSRVVEIDCETHERRTVYTGPIAECQDHLRFEIGS